MKINIGNKIKVLRKKQGITQEQLAERIGVSFQAVSKWENSIAFPDITLVPVIAQYFGVSTDELLSYDSIEKENEIKKAVDEAAECRESNPEKGREILETALKKYPENEILLNNLLYVINYSKTPDKTIILASKLIDKTESDEIKYDALRFLAYAYNAKGDIESAVTALEQVPEIYFTKLSEMAFVLNGKPKYEAAEKQKWLSFETLIQMMWKIAEYYRDEGDVKRAVSETERILKLLEAMKGEEKIHLFDNYVNYFKKQIKNIQK